MQTIFAKCKDFYFMQQQQPKPREYSMDELNRLIDSIKRKENLTEEQIAQRLKYNEGYISQVRSRGKVSPKFIDNLKREFGVGLQNAKKEDNTLQEPEVDYSKPIIQVVLNLSYTSKKNADSMDKMAATNQKNTEIIAALVSAILPNSKLADQLSSSLADLHMDADRPVEDFLPAGADLSKKQKVKEVVRR
jgi:transcriptional regulator with XRE-family HTH domain